MSEPIVVIVAEDDFLVRLATAEALRAEGIEVVEAGHAADALSILEARAEGVHVLFTDIEMPGAMDGVALAHHAARCWPWIALLVASGRVKPGTAALPVGCRFLPKPYAHQHVMTHIRNMTAA